MKWGKVACEYFGRVLFVKEYKVLMYKIVQNKHRRGGYMNSSKVRWWVQLQKPSMLYFEQKVHDNFIIGRHQDKMDDMHTFIGYNCQCDKAFCHCNLVFQLYKDWHIIGCCKQMAQYSGLNNNVVIKSRS